MNVRELVFRGEEETKLYACGECGMCHSPKIYACRSDEAHKAARTAAEKCCTPYTCSVCGIEVPRPWTMCEKHRTQKALRKATPIPAKDWHDPVFSDEMSGDWGDGFSSDIDAMLEHLEDEKAWGDLHEHAAPPAYCWPCKADPLRLGVDRILEHACDEQHEDAWDQIEAADELEAFVEAWNAKQTCVTWHPDHRRVVVLDEARFAKLLEEDQ